MKDYTTLSKEELLCELQKTNKEYDGIKALGLSLNMARGKPGKEQLEYCMPLLNTPLTSDSFGTNSDYRNYGILCGIPEARKLFSELLECDEDCVFVGGNSSLDLMFGTVMRAYVSGICGSMPWSRLPCVRFLCPAPGYDRHFAICSHFGIQMIPIKLNEDGPDMDAVQKYVENDPFVKGIWCVPKYSNPDGITYSDEVVSRFADLKPAAEDFRIFWDNAYIVHDLYDKSDKLLNIFDELKKRGKEDMAIEFVSTSKISFPGAGVAAMAMSKRNLEDAKKTLTVQTIGYDKLNQLRHVNYFGTAENIKRHMKGLAEILRPKFEAVYKSLDELTKLGIAHYHKPRGGYFVSLYLHPGCAKRTYELAKAVGVTLTAAGATYPGSYDPDDSNLRIAPTYPSKEELEKSLSVLSVCARIAALEVLIKSAE
ncbi:MAG: aminotransferase class I/II-fold pyridoxal phosphate-dependent enzyme [Clostridia bacterium]|nr:aminotransferase class I/II-fold pyridoxal phosphate-dependent enzyme [Clostridia bacterium]